MVFHPLRENNCWFVCGWLFIHSSLVV